METTHSSKYTGSDRVEQSESKQEESVEDQSCPDCGGEAITTGTEIVCEECGLVVGKDEIDHGPEWRNFEGGDNSARAAAINTTRSDDGLGTKVGWDHSQTTSARERKLQRTSKIAQKKGTERRQAKAIGDIKQTTSAIELPDIVSDQACKLFKRYHNSGDRTGSSFDHMVAGAIFTAARVNQYPIQAEDLSSQLNVPRNKVFDIAKDIADEAGITIPLQPPHELIPRIITDLGGETKTENLARKLAHEAEDKNLHNGVAPSSIAAAVVYEAFKTADWETNKMTQDEVSEAANISSVTLRNTWQSIHEEDIYGDDIEVMSDV